MEVSEPVLRGAGKPRPAARPEVRVHRAFTAGTEDPLGSPSLVRLPPRPLPLPLPPCPPHFLLSPQPSCSVVG